MKTWEFRLEEATGRVTNSFRSETLEIDGVKVAEKTGGWLRMNSMLFAEIDDAGQRKQIEVYLGQKMPGFTIGCHVYVDGELVAGDTDVKIMCPTLSEVEAKMEGGMRRFLIQEGVLKLGLVYGVGMMAFFALQQQTGSLAVLLPIFVLTSTIFGGFMGFALWKTLVKSRDQIRKEMPFEGRKHRGKKLEQLSERVAKRQKRASMIAVAMLFPIVLVGLVYGFENWRGDRAWERYRAEREAVGESFEFADFVPPEVPAEENFATTPLLQAVFDIEYTRRGPRFRDPGGMEEAASIRLYRRRKDLPLVRAMMGAWYRGEPVNLDALRWYYRGEPERMPKIEVATNRLAGLTGSQPDDEIGFSRLAAPGTAEEDVLYALSKFDTELRKIQIDLQRPHCRYPLNYPAADGSIPLPHLQVVPRIASVYRLRAIARLKGGQTDRAIDDLFVGYDLLQTLENEPFLFTLLVECAVLTRHHQVVWEGLRDRAWSAEQIAEIRTRLEQIRLIERLSRCLHADRLVTINSIGKRDLCYLADAARLSGWSPSPLLRAVPSGWIRLNQVEIGRCFDEIVAALNAGRSPVELPVEQTRSAGAQQAPTVANYLVRKLPIQARSAWIKVLQAQCHVDLAVVACDLELHRLSHGSYPARLPAGTLDRVSGKELNYRRTPDGRFVLYSLGEDGVDDRGRPVRDKETKRGDWVWRYLEATID